MTKLSEILDSVKTDAYPIEIINRLKIERSVYDAELCDEAASLMQQMSDALLRIAINRSEYMCDNCCRDVSKIAAKALKQHRVD